MDAGPSTSIHIKETKLEGGDIQPPSPQQRVMDRTLASAANLVKLLPTVTVLAFQTLSPAFTNGAGGPGGRQCLTANKTLTSGLIVMCSITCIFFTFTDSVFGSDGKLYYGVATAGGISLINFRGTDDDKKWLFKDLTVYRVRWVDYVHAVFSVMLLLALCFNDTSVQACLFPNADADTLEMLRNLPIGLGFFSTLLFMVLPTSRKNIGYADDSSGQTPQSQQPQSLPLLKMKFPEET